MVDVLFEELHLGVELFLLQNPRQVRCRGTGSDIHCLHLASFYIIRVHLLCYIHFLGCTGHDIRSIGKLVSYIGISLIFLMQRIIIPGRGEDTSTSLHGCELIHDIPLMDISYLLCQTT